MKVPKSKHPKCGGILKVYDQLFCFCKKKGKTHPNQKNFFKNHIGEFFAKLLLLVYSEMHIVYCNDSFSSSESL